MFAIEGTINDKFDKQSLINNTKLITVWLTIINNSMRNCIEILLISDLENEKTLDKTLSIYQINEPQFKLSLNQWVYCLFGSDIDECKENGNICPQNRPVCVNVQGSYSCHDNNENVILGTPVTCPAGYKFNPEIQTCEGKHQSTNTHP